jgi:hypothetical protein
MNEFLVGLGKVVKKKKKRDRVIQKARKKQLNCIRNLCYNVCAKKFTLPAEMRTQLLPFKKDIRDLGNRHKLTSLRGLKNRLIQRGGFLPILLPHLLGALGSLVLGRAIGV